MIEKRYHVVFNGKTVPGMDKATVASNLILDVGLAEDKAKALLRMNRAVLKRFPSIVEARRLAEQLELAGLVCTVEDSLAADSVEKPGTGESSLITFITKFKPVSKTKDKQHSDRQDSSSQW